jgi:23S rRNA maturation mini-RNase III
MNIFVTHKKIGQRTHILIRATAKSPATKKLLKELTNEVRAFARRWRAAAKAATRKKT